MLEMRPNCECCDRDLPTSATDAMICSFECTFCAGCAGSVLKKRCPNCSGDLLRRPTRAANLRGKFPASNTRKLKPAGCVS